MSSLSQQGLMQKQRKPGKSTQLGTHERKREWLTLVSSDGRGDVSDANSEMKAEIRRLKSEVESLTRQLQDANNDLLWRDTLAARHAEAYAYAEQEALQESSTS